MLYIDQVIEMDNSSFKIFREIQWYYYIIDSLAKCMQIYPNVHVVEIGNNIMWGEEAEWDCGKIVEGYSDIFLQHTTEPIEKMTGIDEL